MTQISGCLKEVIDLAFLLQAQKKGYFFSGKDFFPVGLFQYFGQLMRRVARFHMKKVLNLLWQQLPVAVESEAAIRYPRLIAAPTIYELVVSIELKVLNLNFTDQPFFCRHPS